MGHIANYNSNCGFVSSPLSQQRAKECSEISKACISECTQVYTQATYRKQMTAEFSAVVGLTSVKKKNIGNSCAVVLVCGGHLFFLFSSHGHFSKNGHGGSCTLREKYHRRRRKSLLSLSPSCCPASVTHTLCPHMWKSRMD